MLVSISIYCSAQNYTEVVYLKNGSVIKGTIIEQIPNVSLKVKTGDGSLIICKMDEVDKITKEENYSRDYRKDFNNRKAARNTLKGYKGFIDFGYMGDVSDCGMDNVTLTTSHGYQFNNHIFLGAGLGVDIYTDASAVSVPLFVNFKANFLKTKVTPFVDVKTGYSVGDADGFFSSVGVGARFSLKGKKAISLMLESKYQEYTTLIAGYYYSSEDTEAWAGVGFKVGFEF